MVHFRNWLLVLSGSAILLSCTDRRMEQPINGNGQTAQLPSAFDLKRDVFNFTSKLSEGDTLEFIADLSSGTSWHTERNIIYKLGGQIMLRSWNEGEFVTNQDAELLPVVYSLQTDTLNFEDLFIRLHQRSSLGNRRRFTLIYDDDTIHYSSSGLGESLRMIAYYSQIKHRLYPESELYNYPEIITK